MSDVPRKVSLCSSRSGRIGSGATRSRQHEGDDQQRRRQPNSAISCGEVQAKSRPPVWVPTSSALTPATSSVGAGPVDLHLARGERQVQHPVDHHERDQAERQVDVEHQRHDALSTRKPPSSGPMTLEETKTTLK